MYEDPQDMFSEIDEMFDRLFARMTRELSESDLPVYRCQIVIGSSDACPGKRDEQTPLGRDGSGPVAEIHRIGDEVKVIVGLPGASSDAIGLEVSGEKLTIDAEGCMTRYHTVADLPPVDAASMQYSFRNGVLEVTFAAAAVMPEEPGNGGK
jgi:HSP20 family molecular chaperone IbpA